LDIAIKISNRGKLQVEKSKKQSDNSEINPVRRVIGSFW